MTHGPDFSVKPTLTGEKVILRPFSEADLPRWRDAARPEARVLTGSVHDKAQAPRP